MEDFEGGQRQTTDFEAVIVLAKVQISANLGKGRVFF